MLVVPKIAQEVMLRNILRPTLILKLFTNNVIPNANSRADDFKEADFLGYSPIHLIGTEWTIQPGLPTVATYPPQQFKSDASQTVQGIFGYFVVETGGGILLWAERFNDGPYPIGNRNDVIQITPSFTLE